MSRHALVCPSENLLGCLVDLVVLKITQRYFFLPLNGFHSICWGIKKSVMKTQQTSDQNSHARVVWRHWNFIFQSKVHWHFTILWCEKTSIKPLHFTILIAFIYILSTVLSSVLWFGITRVSCSSGNFVISPH